MDHQVLVDCKRLALDGKMSFPESLQKMASVGVERYRTDLVRMETTHYSADGETDVVDMHVSELPPIAEEFDAGGVTAALVTIQAGKIDYGEFLRRIRAAGTTDYGVWLKGRLAIYFGRKGEFHVEKFPGE